MKKRLKRILTALLSLNLRKLREKKMWDIITTKRDKKAFLS